MEPLRTFHKGIVKPWSLSQQTPKLYKSLPKKEKKEGFGPWAETFFTWATTATQPITFKPKECSGEKVLQVKVSQNDQDHLSLCHFVSLVQVMILCLYKILKPTKLNNLSKENITKMEYHPSFLLIKVTLVSGTPDFKRVSSPSPIWDHYSIVGGHIAHNL